jgi:hypothetical protein
VSTPGARTRDRVKSVRLAALDEEWAEQGVNIPTY